MTTKICSYNVRGLGNKNKRGQVFAWLKEKQYAICLLQETHSGEGTHDPWAKEWGAASYFSGIKNNSEGVAILINPSLSCSGLTYREILTGRLQALELEINGKEFVLLNVYGPNADDVLYFKTLENYLKENIDKSFIIGGDFNTVLNIAMDKKNGRSDTHKACRNYLNTIAMEYDLIDIWRSTHPTLKQYTWHSSNKPPIFSRLDYFLLSENLVNSVVSCEHRISYKSDHSIVELKVDINNTQRGPGYFKLNNTFLLDNQYQENIRNSIQETTTINRNANPNTLWELIKGTIRNETIRYGTMKKKERNKNEQKLTNEIENLETMMNNSNNNDTIDLLKQQIDAKKTELNTLIEIKTEGYILRSKAQIIEEGEKNSKFFASLEKKRAESKIISRLNINGRVITDQDEILKEEKKYYQKLYSKQKLKSTTYNFFDETIEKLNEDEKNICEGVLTELECVTALKEMKNKKSPGSDGLTTEFYKIFWKDIKRFYLDSINYSYQHGKLTELQTQSIISLIPKSEKDTSFLENWRPISLLNVDYKIATKTIANRVKRVLHKIIHNSQTGFLKGRFIGENIRILYEVLDYTDEQDIPGMIFFSDFEKAFDSVDHEFLTNCLKHFNFGNDFISWINLFYSNAKSCVSNNGFQSDFFQIKRGVRQGCPLSPYLFILCMELLTHQIRLNENIKGISITGPEIKNSCYADDASFVLDGSQKSFETLIDVLENFSYISGLKLNSKKCQVLRIGTLRNSNIIYSKKKHFLWSSTEAKALGMTFCTNKEDLYKLNLEPKIKQFQNVLKQWQHRKLTLMGKITVIKTFALPKLIYALSSLPNPPMTIIKAIEKDMYAFLWNNKPEKIKRKTIIQNYCKGGLKMIDIQKFMQAQKVTWIKRILDPNNKTILNEIYLHRLNKFGGALYFECNFNQNDILNNFKQNDFFTDILLAWNEVNYKEIILDYSNEIIWNNSNIKAGNRTICYKNWSQLGIKYIKDIYNYSQQKLHTFEKLKELYKVPNQDFLKYISLVRSIPNGWKSQLKQESGQVPLKQTLFNQLVCVKQTNRFVYNVLLQFGTLEMTKSEQKWTNIFSNEELNWKKIYIMPFVITSDNKLREFQYKYLKRIIPSNNFLNKCKLVSSSLCDFCNMEIETLDHLFWECRHVQVFWMQLRDFLHTNRIELEVTLRTVTFGLSEKYTCNTNIKNFIILIAKYYIFLNKYYRSIPNLHAFKIHMKKRLRIEKEIALMKDKLFEFERQWGNIMNVFELV